MRIRGSNSMEGSYSTNKKAKVNNGVIPVESSLDRISELPEPILHHILSFLQVKEVIKTCFLSKKWRKVWASVPDLNFDNYDEDNIDLIYRVLLFREATSLRKFILTSPNTSLDLVRLDTWLIFAIRKCVKEVHLKIPFNRPHVLPHVLFTSSIEVLKLTADLRRAGVLYSVQLPSSICSAPRLRTIELVSVKLPEGNLDGELVWTCPLLENMLLKLCDHKHVQVLNISAFQLKNLIIYGPMVNSNSSKLKICAPNLKSLEFELCSYSDYSLENLSSIVIAKIGSPYEELLTERVVKALTGLRDVTTLVLSGFFMTSADADIFYQLGNQYANLRCLKLAQLHNDSCLIAIVLLLRRTPYIEDLFVEIIENYSDEAQDWSRLLLVQYPIFHLKHIKIKFHCGLKNEQLFLEFLLKNALVLERVTITLNKPVTIKREKEFGRFITKLYLLPKASSRVTITLL